MFMVREACNPAGVMGPLLAGVCDTGNYKSQLTSSDDELEGSASWDADEEKTETVSESRNARASYWHILTVSICSYAK